MKCYMGHFGRVPLTNVRIAESNYQREVNRANEESKVEISGNIFSPVYASKDSPEAKARLEYLKKQVEIERKKDVENLFSSSSLISSSFSERINIGTLSKPVWVNKNSAEGQKFITQQKKKFEQDMLNRKNPNSSSIFPDVNTVNKPISEESSNKSKVVGGLAIAGLATYFLMKD